LRDPQQRRVLSGSRQPVLNEGGPGRGRGIGCLCLRDGQDDGAED
jgi:hypothetical protein